MSDKRKADDAIAETQPKKPKANSMQSIHTADGRFELLKSGRWADFKIKCQDRVFNVHRALLGGQSEYFDRAMAGDFKEAAEQELDLSSEEPLIIAAVLSFMYTGVFRLRDLEKIASWIQYPTDDVLQHKHLLLAKIHACAKYLMLQPLCDQVFRNLSDRLYHTFIDRQLSPDQQVTKQSEILDCVRLVFEDEHPNEDLRAMFSWILTAMNKPNGNTPLLSDKELGELLDSHSSLGAYMYRTLALQSRLDQKCHTCTNLIINETRSARYVLIELGAEVRVVSCYCSWRGLCSQWCYSPTPEIFSDGTLCLPCAMLGAKTHRREDIIFVFEGGQIRHRNRNLPRSGNPRNDSVQASDTNQHNAS